MRDLIRNYRMALRKNKFESDTESESQPLTSSLSSNYSNNSFNTYGAVIESNMFNNDDSDTNYTKNNENQIPNALLQQKINRSLMYPRNYETPELDHYENFNKNSSLKIILGNSDYGEDETNELFLEERETHSSIVTIFAVWNTTVGTSLLSMSWGISKTGLFPAIFLNILIAAICLYTTYILLKINEKHGLFYGNYQVCVLCKLLIGKWAEILAKTFSLVVLIGANIVYWILMSNFFYNSVHFLYGFLLNLEQNNNQTVICPRDLKTNETVELVTNFDRIWNLYSTVPIILAIIVFPLLNWKSAAFFTKFNSLGTLSVLYLILYVGTKSWFWGINIKEWQLEFQLKPTFCALTGMLSLSYFIHNIIIQLMQNNRNQKKNGRDLTIAFGLITFTYLFIGVVFYVSFPLAKSCIEDNILNNFNKFDILTIIARILLLFQLFTVFPLISFMLRNEIFMNLKLIFQKIEDFKYSHVILLNVSMLIICVLFACFLPRIGTLIRYTGALSGMVYIFLLPSLLKLASLRKDRKINIFNVIFHLSITVIGCLNLISQFFINDE